MPVDGAFETHYQTCPLDLCEDTFFAARKDAIALRLSEIEGGKAIAYLKKHDSEHRAAKPCVVGVRWDVCTRRGLIDVVKVRAVFAVPRLRRSTYGRSTSAYRRRRSRRSARCFVKITSVGAWARRT